MQYLKRNTKNGIFTFLIIVISITISISTLTKTEVYFSLYDNPQILSNDSSKQEVKAININSASQDELMKMLRISELLFQKTVTLRDSLSEGFKNPDDFLQLPELTDLNCLNGKKRG